MRGAFVACFGQVDRARLESVAEAHRWHRGRPEYQAAPGFDSALLTDAAEGPHVETRGGTTTLVHGGDGGSFGDLCGRGRRFAIIESDGSSLRAARDPLGLAPLFYRVLGRSLWLATEVSALAALGDISPDLQALSAQAALVPCDERTGFTGIHRVLPGHSLHVTADLLVSQRRYWDPARLFGSFEGSRAEAEDELWARLLAGVDACTLEGRTGVLLSGGTDSAAVTAAAARLQRPLALVHVAFRDHPDAVEEAYARTVAEAANAELDVVPGHAVRWHPDEDLEVAVVPYLTPPAYTANAALARLSEQGVAAALDGNDGDGLFGIGGREWAELVSDGSIRRLGQLGTRYGTRPVAAGLANDMLPPRVLRTIRRRPSARPTYLQEIERYFDPALHERMRAADLQRWRRPFGEWRRRQLRQVLPVTTVRMEEHELRGARYGVDLRHPFADRDLVEFAVSLPAAIKADPMESKSLLRAALAGRAPDAVVLRTVKPQYLSILDRRVDLDRCLDWVEESGVRLPLVNYAALFDDRARSGRIPPFLLLVLARAHVFAAGI